MTDLTEVRALRSAVDSIKNPFDHTTPEQEALVLDAATRLADMLDVQTERTRTEWTVEYFLWQPGNYASPMSEKEARAWAAAEPEHTRLVSRTVTESSWAVEGSPS